MELKTIEQCEKRISEIEIELRWRSVICGQVLAVKELKAEIRNIKNKIIDIQEIEIRKEKELEQEINQDMDRLRLLIKGVKSI